MADGCEGPEETEALDIRVGLAEDPEETAKEALREHQQRQGLQIEDPDKPVPGPDVPEGEQEEPSWMRT